MKKLASSTEYILVPFSGPADESTTFGIAIVDEDAGEPATADYQTALIINGEAALLLPGGSLPDGVYKVYLRIQANPEDVRLPAGRLRIGDNRT